MCVSSSGDFVSTLRFQITELTALIGQLGSPPVPSASRVCGKISPEFDGPS